MEKRGILFSILTITCLLFSSCFDLVEDVNMLSNGKGSIKATINLSKSKTKVASLMKLDKVDGIKVPSKSEIQTEMNTILRLLKQTPGISNVNSSLDFTNFIATLSCDFNNINALNNFSKTVSSHFKSKMSNNSSYAYDAGKKYFVRTYTFAPEGKNELSKLKPENQKSFQDAYYTTIYRFQDEITKQTNPVGKISSNKKNVMVKVSVLDLINGKSNLANQISLSK